MTISEFGKSVLDYFENSTNSGDTILFSLDSEIYEQVIFQGNTTILNGLERDIQKHVNTYGLDLTYVADKDLYAIALAAHQIILSYQYRDDESTINSALLNAYFPYQTNANILYSKYYGNSQTGNNYQEKLWTRVQTVIKQKLGRNLIIPINPGGNRDQKYIKAQLCLFRNLKNYFFSLFYRYGFSKEIQYSKDEFISRIITVNKNLNYAITGKMVDSLWDKLRKYSQDDFGTLSLDDSLLFELLWTIYKSWDGTFPYDDSYRSSDDFYNPIYVELNEDDCTFNTQQGRFFQSMLISTTNRNCYFRFFTYIGDDVWEAKDSAVSDLPESEAFVLLIEKDSLRFFSKKCRLEFEPSKELLSSDNSMNNYLILKYFSLPKDFYDGFPYVDMVQSNTGLQLKGGLRLSGKTYLDFSDKRLNPSIYSGSPRVEQIPRSVVINGVKIEEYNSIDANKIRLHLYSPSDSRINLKVTPLFQTIPEFKFSKKVINLVQIDKSGVDITSYIYRAELNGLVSKGGFIPCSRIKVVSEESLIGIKDFTDFSDYNKFQLTNVRFGWFEKDDELFSPSESVSERLKIVKTLEFKVRLIKEQPYISEFWVTEIYGCDVTDYFGDDNHTKEPDIDESVIVTPKDDYSGFNYISVNDQDLYEPNSYETPFYYDEIRTFQKALCVWICHFGMASYQDIQNVCKTMIQKTEFPDVYGESPEYQIFMPLFKMGIIIPVIKEANQTVFTVVEGYEDILHGTDLSTIKVLQNYIPEISSMLKMSELFSPSSLNANQVFVRFSKYSWSW